MPSLDLHAAVNSELLGIYLEQLIVLAFSDCELPFAQDTLLLFDKLIEMKILQNYSRDRYVLPRFMEFGLPVDHDELVLLTEKLRVSSDPMGDLHKFMHGPHDYPELAEEEDDVVVSAAFIPKQK